MPSRIHAGKFYALPQAPQQYKQLLMMSGFDRYFQIAPCFRDEDPRADRLPGEFYQLDVEMSFVEQDDVFAAMEPVITGVFEEFAGGMRRRQEAVTQSWPRIPYDEAIAKYGSDKPDLRNPIEMQDVTEHFRGSGFKIFAGMIEKDPKVRVWAIPAPGGGSRAFCDRMNAWAQRRRPAGARLHLLARGRGRCGAGPVAQEPRRRSAPSAIRTQLGLKEGDAVFFTAGNPASFYKFAGEARDAHRRGAEARSTRAKLRASPGSSTSRSTSGTRRTRRSTSRTTRSRCRRAGSRRSRPRQGDDDDLELKAYQYDIVCNGFEIASGSVRNHRPDTMVKAFEITGLTQAEVESPVRRPAIARSSTARRRTAAWRPASTASSCCWRARRTCARSSLFPMNQQANDLLMGAPSEVPPKQLRELSIRVVAPEKKD